MSIVALRRPPVPSPSTLRYLRAQVDLVTTSTTRSACCLFSTQGTSRAQSAATIRAHQASPAATIPHRLYSTGPLQRWRASKDFRIAPGTNQTRSFATNTPRAHPREVARRPSPNEKWHLRRPSPPDSTNPFAPSPDPLSSSLSPTLSFMDDHSALGPRLTKPHPDQRLRCTEFDENGNVTLVNGEFRKSELIQKYGLQPRDLRKIDSSLLPTILVRPKAILLNLLHIRCLIQADRVLVFDAYGSTDSYTQSLFMYDLEGKLSLREGGRGQGQLPYEFRALEAVLISVTTALEGEFEGVRGPVVQVLRELEENIDRDKLRLLLVLSKKIGTFEQRARLVRDAIDELLEADDDLAAMYLTEKKEGHERGEEDHTEVEMLLESYDKVCDEIVQVSGNLVTNIRNTEEIVKAILDANRNSLMLLDLKFSIGTLGIGAGTFVAALYGMNLKSFIEEWDFGFPLVSATCAVFTVIACVYGFRKLRKVQRLSMWGEGEVASRGHMQGKKRWSTETKAEHYEGKEDWRGVEHVAERLERMEKEQWKAAEKLRKMRMMDREEEGVPSGGSKGAPLLPAK